ncbi:TPA: hypothetical protein ACPHXD_002722 [Pseudomonas aeruginosa]|nr:hypothetical protein [Pseudomonas aeruginosa]
MKNTLSTLGLTLVIAGGSAAAGYFFGFESGKEEIKASHITAKAAGLTKAQKLTAEDTLSKRVDYILSQDAQRFDMEVIPVEIAFNKECVKWQ